MDFFTINPLTEFSNTNNSLEVTFVDLKTKLRNHNGLSIKNRKMFIDEYSRLKFMQKYPQIWLLSLGLIKINLIFAEVRNLISTLATKNNKIQNLINWLKNQLIRFIMYRNFLLLLRFCLFLFYQETQTDKSK